MKTKKVSLNRLIRHKLFWFFSPKQHSASLMSLILRYETKFWGAWTDPVFNRDAPFWCIVSINLMLDLLYLFNSIWMTYSMVAYFLKPMLFNITLTSFFLFVHLLWTDAASLRKTPVHEREPPVIDSDNDSCQLQSVTCSALKHLSCIDQTIHAPRLSLVH